MMQINWSGQVFNQGDQADKSYKLSNKKKYIYNYILIFYVIPVVKCLLFPFVLATYSLMIKVSIRVLHQKQC